MVIYFKILKYLFAGVLIGILLYLILSNITVTVEIDPNMPTFPPCPEHIDDITMSCPS